MEYKFCHKCQQDKLVVEFRKSFRHKDGMQTQCRTCMDIASEAWRQRNLEKRRDQQRELCRANASRFYQWKSTQKCLCCSESDVVCLDLHHLDSETKERNVSDMVANSWSWERIMQEVEKCIVVCRNCHAKIHAGKISISGTEACGSQ